ncbi:MAG: 50S ribosomal protein L11 methyltransferase [Sphingomonadales bacterium]
MTSQQGYWQIRFDLPAADVARAEQALLDAAGDNTPSIAAFADADSPQLYHLEAYFGDAPDAARLRAALIAELGELPADCELTQMPPRDWVAETQAMLPAISAGRFHVHGAHAQDSCKPGQIGLLVEAAQAFGTGRHETTFGCLLALDWLAKRRHAPRRALDLGCGSAVLALAMAKAWRLPVMASDIDPVSLRVAAENVRANGVLARHGPRRVGICLRHAHGFADRSIRAGRPYDLIAANILAGPLTAMSKDLARAAAANGRIILSGLLASQQAGVLAAYRRQGWALEKKIRIGDWPTLILRSGGGVRERDPAPD